MQDCAIFYGYALAFDFYVPNNPEIQNFRDFLTQKSRFLKNSGSDRVVKVTFLLAQKVGGSIPVVVKTFGIFFSYFFKFYKPTNL